MSPGGTTKGGDRTFTTPKVPLSLAIAGAPDPVVFGNPFFVEGTLSGTGASTREIVLQANVELDGALGAWMSVKFTIKRGYQSMIEAWRRR